MIEIIDYLKSLGFEQQESEGGEHSFTKNETDHEYNRIFDFKCAQQHIIVSENKFVFCYLTKTGVKKGVEHATGKDIQTRALIEVHHYGSLLPLIKFYFETMPTQKLPD